MDYILLLLLSLFSVTHENTEKIDIVNSYRIGGINQRTAEYIHTSLPENFNVPINVDNCQQAIKILENSKKPVIAVWDAIVHSTSFDKSCDVFDNDKFVMIYAESYYSICGLKTNKFASYEKLMEGAKIGVPDYFIMKTQLSETLKNMKSKSNMIPYMSSKEVLAALEIGEIDFAYTGRVSSNMNCVLTHDPLSTAVRSTSEYFQGPFSTSGHKIVIIGANVDKEYTHEKLQITLENSNWNLVFTGYNTSGLSVEQQYSTLIDGINQLKKIIE